MTVYLAADDDPMTIIGPFPDRDTAGAFAEKWIMIRITRGHEAGFFLVNPQTPEQFEQTQGD